MLRSIMVVSTAFLAGCGGIFGDGAGPSPRLLYGRRVEVRLAQGEQLGGELLAASRDSLWVLSNRVAIPLALDEVRRIRVERHTVESGSVLGWAGVGALLTGIGMTSACSQVAVGCGSVFVMVAVPWALFGTIAAAGISSSRWEDVPRAQDALRPYTRYPQGLPASATLVAPPPDRRESPGVRAPGPRRQPSEPGSRR